MAEPSAPPLPRASVGRVPSSLVRCPACRSFEKLFARVTPDDCSWTLDGEHVVITLEKTDSKPWQGLGPLGSE